MKWSIPERIVNRGRSYVDAGRVISVLPDAEHQVWHAEVLGAEVYLVDLDGTAKEQDHCECPYWVEHQYCKHTVAVELYLRDQGLSRILAQNEKPEEMDTDEKRDKKTEMFTRGFRHFQSSEAPHSRESVQPLAVRFIVEQVTVNPYQPEQDILTIYLRIGFDEKHLYIVKNIHEFLTIFAAEETLVLNKKYRFVLAKQAFRDEDYRMLQQLAAFEQTQLMIRGSGIPVSGRLDKRYLFYPVQAKEQLLQELIATKHFLLQLAKDSYKTVELAETDKPLHFTVSKADHRYKLAVEQQFDVYFANYQWGFLGQTLYRLSPRQQDIYLTLHQLLKRFSQPEIFYTRKELSNLFQEVIPVLREIGVVDIAAEVLDEISEASLRTVLTFRKKQGKIVAEAAFHYGDAVFGTNEQVESVSEATREVLRDVQAEKRVLDLFPLFGYQKNKNGFEKPLPVGERLYQFFKREVPVFQQNGEVRLGTQLRKLFLDSHEYKPQLTVDENSTWLEVRFDVSGIHEDEIDEVLKSLLRHENFYTLKDGKVLSFDSDEFVKTSQLLHRVREQLKSENGTIQLPKNQALSIQQKLGTDTSYSVSFQKMVYDLTHPKQFDAAIPKGLQAVLREYQFVGYQWLKMLGHYQFGGILADEMGLGKTLQMITYLLSEKEEHQQLSALVVAPASLIYNWQAELKRFAPDLSLQTISGTAAEREEQLQQPVDVRITSYNSFRQDQQLYQELSINYLVMDEAQMVKNSGTKTAKALRELEVPQRFALSGTPIENNLEELWALFQNVMPGLLPNRTRFRQMSAAEVAKIVQPFVLRREKQAVLQDLPEKIEANMYSVLTEEQKTVYLAYLRQMREEVSLMDEAAFRKNRISILAGLTRLRQICCDPRLFMEDYQGGSGKLEQVKDLLTTAKENGRRILLFSQFTSMLTILEKELAALGLSSFYLRGSTPPKERLTMVDAFNSGEKDVFLISLKAGGTGLNLTGADTVILYDLWWNPAVEEQAASRAHRIGQKKVVEVWRLISEGTIEEQMDTMQQEKRELFQKVIQGSDQQLTQLTEADIRLILSMGEE